MKRFYAMCCVLATMTIAWAQGPNNSGTYYRNADGKSGQTLKTALFNIIKNHKKIGYDNLYEAYKKTDTRPDGYVRDWYSNATNYRHGTDKGGTYSAEGDCYNREHSLPQSWFESGGNADYLKCDVVHVIPTDGYVNNRRSNYPLGEVRSATYSSKNGYSKLGMSKVNGYSGTVFEPNDEIKGDMARIYFYVVTCYEGNVTKWSENATASAVFNGQTYQPFKDWYYNMLLEWSRMDPVDEVEIARNNAVYGVQNNRNPFVDYPGLEDYVWGDKKNEPFSYDNYNTTVAVRTPTFSPDGGTYTSAQSVTISCATAGAAIYYTTDGSTPTASSTKYTAPVTVSESLTLKAIAIKDDDKSNVATASYTIKDEGDDPTPTGDGIFKKVTSTSDLESGKRYLIVYEGDEAKALMRLDGKAGSSSVTVNSSSIDMNQSGNQAMVLTLQKVGNDWTIKGSDGNFMALTSNSNTLNSSTTAAENTAKWTISVSSDGTASITNVEYSNRQLQYNASSDMFRCYTGSQKDVAIYKESSTATGITATKTGKKSNVLYDLQGRRQSKNAAKRGVYIVNGQKFIVK